MEYKICARCDENKSVDEYRMNQSTCKKCWALAAKKRREDSEVRKRDIQKMKDNYEKNRELRVKEAADNRKKVYEKVLSGELQKPNIESKKCNKCTKIKPVEQFTFYKNGNRYDSHCKECNMNRERERRALHKEAINKRRREIQKPKTPEQKLILSLRKRLNAQVKSRPKKNYYLDLLGCDIKFLHKWMEYNFDLDEDLGMTWKNIGEVWHIDHVTPCSSFDLNDKEQQEICFHWSNLRPVLGPYNLSKGNKIIKEDIVEIAERAKNFIKINDKEYEYEYTIINQQDS